MNGVESSVRLLTLINVEKPAQVSDESMFQLVDYNINELKENVTRG